jgi:phosphoribosyl-AMP cyclohydrolase
MIATFHRPVSFQNSQRTSRQSIERQDSATGEDWHVTEKSGIVKTVGDMKFTCGHGRLSKEIRGYSNQFGHSGHRFCGSFIDKACI